MIEDGSIEGRMRLRYPRGPGFTLVEMVVVIAVIVTLVGIVLPAAATLWNQRRFSESYNTVSGMLKSVRGRALHNENGETGLFFFLDDEGVQRIAGIRRNPKHSTIPVDSGVRTWQTDIEWQKVFTIVEDRSYTLPPPMRAVPRYAVEDNANRPGAEDWQLIDDAELANEDFNNPPGVGLGALRHRNFFTVVYSSEGGLELRRDVLIRDVDADEDLLGDVTGLVVGGKEIVKKYYPQSSAGNVDILPSGEPLQTDSILVDKGGVALNFPSVDGLLVYDDSLFRQAGTPVEKRAYLLGAGQPFYIHRMTGEVVRGPAGGH